jgi:hypothetical protein
VKLASSESRDPRPLWAPNKKPRWPPYELVEESLEEKTAAKMDRLERLYHVGQNQQWDGKKVLADLIAKHGPPRLPPEKREATMKLLSVLLWGELAAWAISADLAEQIEDVEAKMAATSQAHDEARHFYVLRDYCRALGEPVPRLGGLGRTLLVSILETPSLVHKLLGMQLLAESNALALFRGLVDAGVEPVISELLPYYEKDEARHVGLGVLYLPRLLARQSQAQAAASMLFQVRSVLLIISAGLTMRPQLELLGFDLRKLASSTVKLQDEILREMWKTMGVKPGRLAGVVNPRKGVGPKVLDFLHPPDGKPSTGWKKTALRAWVGGARIADRVLA